MKIQGGILQWDALSLLLFVIATMPLNYILKNCAGNDKFTKWQVKTKHLMYMDDIKLFVRNEKENIDTQIQTIRIYSQYIRMEFGREKCVMLKIKSGQRQMMEGIELPNQERIRTLEEKENYQHWGIFKVDTIKQVETKEKITEEFLRQTRKLLKTKLWSRNLIKWINTRAVPLIRYSEPFSKWRREELQQIDHRRR